MVKLTVIGWRASCWINFCNISSWALVLLLAASWRVEALENECGGFYDLGSGSQVFYSPNYPSDYPEGSYCVWIIEAARDHRVKINFSFTGARYNGNCVDYIEVRDGGPTSAILGTYCDAHTNVELTSTNIWLFVMLKSDLIVPSSSPVHLIVTATAVYDGTPVAAVTNQVPECRSYQFECTNRVCISMSYRCDAYNDCGCLNGCDEDGCGSLSIDLNTQIGISVSVGVVLFIIICFIAHMFEGRNVWLGNKTEAILEKEMQKQVQRRRASRMYSKFIGPSAKSNMMIFDKNANRKDPKKFDSPLKITDYDA